MSENNPINLSRKGRSSFTGSMAYVLATAGASVGLGNIWRFPYLAARYGGGAFLVVYFLMVLFFGLPMIISETALGRLTHKSPIGAYREATESKALRAGGWINAIVPMVLGSYYCAIGGWVTRYFWAYIAGETQEIASDSFFGAFISSSPQAEFWFLVFLGLCLIVIALGVQKGIERVSKVMMPALVVLALIVAVYTCTRPGAGQGVAYLFIPHLSSVSWRTAAAAMEQSFFSLSIAMGIIITYGSYMPKEVDIEKTQVQVAVTDTAIAVIASMIIIPAIFAYSSPDKLNAGPSLMFISIPKIFAHMPGGRIIGLLFFLMVFFAAFTSAIALLETSASTFEDELHASRGKATACVAVIALFVGSASAIGYGTWSNVQFFGMQILDFLDFVINSLLLPIGAFATCLLIVRSLSLEAIDEEISLSSRFRLKKLYNVCTAVIAPVCIALVLVASCLQVAGIIAI